MQIIATHEAKRQFGQLIRRVHRTRRPIGIGPRRQPEALLIEFPGAANATLDAMTNMNAYGGGFDFLTDEPDTYTRANLRKQYR